jgi:hypothetical protein
MMLVASVGLARPSSVRIGLEATGSFKPRMAELDAETRGVGERRKTDQIYQEIRCSYNDFSHLFVQL